MLPTRALFAFFPLFAVVPSAFADTLQGKVVGIVDGDTIDVLAAGNELRRIRLAGIDAPEKRQPFGNAAKRGLSDLVYGKEVPVDWYKRDRYGRIVGKVWVTPADMDCTDNCPKTLDTDLAMLTVGLAWHYKKYEAEQSQEGQARYAFAKKRREQGGQV